MSNVFFDLQQIHDQFQFPRPDEPQLLDDQHMESRVNFLYEELQETQDAFAVKDLEEVIDGLIDLMYVAAGTLDLMGVNGLAHWQEVHKANLQKRSGSNDKRVGMPYDLVKPPGWQPPNHKRILEDG